VSSIQNFIKVNTFVDELTNEVKTEIVHNYEVNKKYRFMDRILQSADSLVCLSYEYDKKGLLLQCVNPSVIEFNAYKHLTTVLFKKIDKRENERENEIRDDNQMEKDKIVIK